MTEKENFLSKFSQAKSKFEQRKSTTPGKSTRKRTTPTTPTSKKKECQDKKTSIDTSCHKNIIKQEEVQATGTCRKSRELSKDTHEDKKVHEKPIREILLGNMTPPIHLHQQPPKLPPPITYPAVVENSRDPSNMGEPQSSSREDNSLRNVDPLLSGAGLNELPKVNYCTTLPTTTTAPNHSTFDLQGNIAPQVTPTTITSKHKSKPTGKQLQTQDHRHLPIK